jgi:hypothetical protein
MDPIRLMKNLEHLSLVLNPDPEMINISVDILGSNLMSLRQIVAQAGAMAQAGAETNEQVLSALPNAGSADLAGTFNLMDLFSMAGQMGVTGAEVEIAEPNIPAAKSAMAYSLRVLAERVVINLALPKEHFEEFSQAAMEIGPQMQSAGMNIPFGEDMSGVQTVADANIPAQFQMPQPEDVDMPRREEIAVEADIEQYMPESFYELKELRQKHAADANEFWESYQQQKAQRQQKIERLRQQINQ